MSPQHSVRTQHGRAGDSGANAQQQPVRFLHEAESGIGVGTARREQAMAGERLTAWKALHAGTRGAAKALGLADEIGDFEPGRQFDALWLRPPAGSTLDVCMQHADGPEDVLAKAFALATPADVDSVWVGGHRVPSTAEKV